MSKAQSVTITDAAREKLLELLAEQDLEGHGVRLYARKTGAYRFAYGMGLVPPGEEPEADAPIQLEGLTLWIDADSVEHLEGATLSFAAESPGGFHFENPRTARHFDNPLAQRVHDLIEARVNPAIAAHGGFIDLVRVEGKVAYVEMGGGCQGCGMAKDTLREVAHGQLLAEIDELEEVIDLTDHAEGEKPFFETRAATAEPS